MEDVICKFNNVKPQNFKFFKKKTQHSIFIWENLSLVIRYNNQGRISTPWKIESWMFITNCNT